MVFNSAEGLKMSVTVLELLNNIDTTEYRFP